jgi:hypothetical protein
MGDVAKWSRVPPEQGRMRGEAVFAMIADEAPDSHRTYRFGRALGELEKDRRGRRAAVRGSAAARHRHGRGQMVAAAAGGWQIST